MKNMKVDFENKKITNHHKRHFIALGVGLVLLIAVFIVAIFAIRKPSHENYLLIDIPTGKYEKVVSKLDSQLIKSETDFSFDYCDDFFSKSSEYFDDDIAKFTASVSAASYSKQYARLSLEKMKYTNVKQYWYSDDGVGSENYWKSTKEDYSRVAFSLAEKETVINGEEVTIYAIVIRGTVSDEWYGDFDIGNPASKEWDGISHAGFKVACEQWVMPYVYQYITSKTLFDSDKSLIWITGHSRGAAVANLVGKHLIDNDLSLNDKGKTLKLANENNIYTYTYACPNVQIMSDEDEEAKTAVYPNRPTEYKGIYNFTNPGDFVTALPIKEWGFAKFGTEIFFDMKDQYLNSFKKRFKAITGVNYNGIETTKRFSELIAKWCPTLEDFYRIDSKFNKSPIDVLNSISPVLAKDFAFKDAITFLSSMGLVITDFTGHSESALGYMIWYVFSGGPSTIYGGFAQAHSLETYVSYVNTMYAGDYAYYETSQIAIRMEDNIKGIGSLSFAGNEMLHEVILSQSLQRIDAFAFVENPHLKRIIMPTALQLIGPYAFNAPKGEGIRQIAFLGDAPQGIDETTFSEDCVLYVKENNTSWSIVNGRYKGYLVKYWNGNNNDLQIT